MPVPALAPRSPERPWDIVVFGENSLDFVARLSAGPSSPGKQTLEGFDILTGGQCATAAIGCARLGARVCYVGAFGRDPWGAQSREALAGEGVEVVALERAGAQSRIAVILVAPDGERTVFERRDPALALDDPSPATAPAVRARLVLVDAEDLKASVAVAKAARAAGARTVVDIDRTSPDAVELLSVIDVIVAPAAVVRELAESDDLGEALLKLETRLRPLAIIATMGERGSMAVVSGTLVSTPAFAVDVQDTTGAGDAFRAGLCAAWVSSQTELEWPDLMEFAAATAALNCRASGAQAGLPTREEVARFLTSPGLVRSKL